MKSRSLTEEEQITNTDTMKHILVVRTLLIQIIQELIVRANNHDQSKLNDPEVKLFTEHSKKLSLMEYGSDEYKHMLTILKPALTNHYKNNSHHPEHFTNGIHDMNLIDLIEMLCDWKASSLRVKNDNFVKSLEIQKERFNIDDQLYNILLNTLPVIEEMAKKSMIDLAYHH